MVLFLKNVFSALLVRFFWQKIRKFRTWEKSKYDEEKVLFREKKCYPLFRILFLQNEKAQNMPEVAGCRVYKYNSVTLGILKYNTDYSRMELISEKAKVFNFTIELGVKVLGSFCFVFTFIKTS